MIEVKWLTRTIHELWYEQIDIIRPGAGARLRIMGKHMTELITWKKYKKQALELKHGLQD